MSRMIERAGLKVDARLARFVEEQALPGTGLGAEAFWAGAAAIFERFAPANRALLARRQLLQDEIDGWHDAHRGMPVDQQAYEGFLREIGYLVEEPAPFEIAPGPLDAEITEIAGPQLVVPMLNRRFLLNAANARWGSLYDALYGSDALAPPLADQTYDPARGERVIAWAKAFLDEAVPLCGRRWADLTDVGDDLRLVDPSQYVGSSGDNRLFRHNGLHIEIVVDRRHPVGRTDPAGIADVLLEAATTTICDLEDSVAAVDAEDKVAGYENWLGLMRGDLAATFEKGLKQIVRTLAEDRSYVAPDGGQVRLPGRSLLLVRNVGLLMTTPAVLLRDGQEAPEGVLDGIVTALIALHDLKGLGRRRNSRSGAVYIVKPKLHGPDEAAFTDALFDAVEDLLGLTRHTIKVGVMDEERRTSANLAATIAAVKNRIFFVNTGFLDRTGDEIHTSMRAGPMIPKAEMKTSPWLRSYEDRNVQIALACGFSRRAQIGKGMWAFPDRMGEMLAQKLAHPLAGATTAWVPSPTAAVLHATHYHRLDVFARHLERANEPVAPLSELLTPPVSAKPAWSPEAIARELENNAQGILGYVARWVEQGVGCSKVPDIDDVGLMEDRATLRISSQHMANWLLHAVASEQQVEAVLSAMAAKVDAQNAADPQHRPMAGREADSVAFQAARALVFHGASQPNGYTEPLLHAFRLAKKKAALPR
jgi:malate synthase